eukprot:Pgem_evm1s6175
MGLTSGPEFFKLKSRSGLISPDGNVPKFTDGEKSLLMGLLEDDCQKRWDITYVYENFDNILSGLVKPDPDLNIKNSGPEVSPSTILYRLKKIEKEE